MAAVGGSATLVAVFGGSHVLADTYGEHLGNGYSRKFLEYPVFDLRLLKRCLQLVSSSVFGSLDPFSMAEYCHAFEGGRASRLDDVTFQSSTSLHYRRAVNAVAGLGRLQHRGSVASHRGLPQVDW